MTETKTQNNVPEKQVDGEALEQALTDMTTETEPVKKQRIVLHENNLVTIDKREYRLVEDYREAFDIEQINERYSDVLNRYDYIVGDIGFEQLRLKGFFGNHQKKMPLDTRIGALQDYLYEYCNFGCAYFVLERLDPSEIQPGPNRGGQQRNRRNNNRKNRPQNQDRKQGAHTQEKQIQGRGNKGKSVDKKRPVIKNRREAENKPNRSQENQQIAKVNQATGKRNFTIRQTDSDAKGE